MQIPGKSSARQRRLGTRVDTTIFDPETGMIASATREGTIHIFHEDTPDTYTSSETVKTEFGAKRWARSETHNLIYGHFGFWSVSSLCETRPIRSQSPSRERSCADLRPAKAGQEQFDLRAGTFAWRSDHPGTLRFRNIR